MTVRPRGAGFQANIMLGGERYRPTFETEEAALTWESQARLAHQLGKPIPQPPTKVTQGGGRVETLDELHKQTKRDRWDQRRSGDRLARNAEGFLEFKGRNTKIDAVTSDDLYDWAHHLRTVKRNDDATVNRKMSAVQVMFKKAHKAGIIKFPPSIEKFKEKSAGSASDFFDFGEEDPILTTLNHRGLNNLARLVMFLADTGARIHEALDVPYANFQHGRVRFEATKNGGWRTVPLTKRARLSVDQCRTAGKHPTQPFGDMTYRWALDNIRSVYDHLGGRYENIAQPFHIYRHSCASRLAIRGVDARRIMEWMDHSSLSVTMVYMKLAPAALDDVVDALEPDAPSLRRVK